MLFLYTLVAIDFKRAKTSPERTPHFAPFFAYIIRYKLQIRCINIINLKLYTHINNVNILYKKYLFIQNIVVKHCM